MVAFSSQARDSRPQLFINYRKGELHKTFIKRLLPQLKKVNYFIDDNMEVGRPISYLFTKIEESAIALAIFSQQYTESEWCLDELQKMKELVEEGRLTVIPIFVNVTTSEVKNLKGVFGQNFEKMRKKHAGEPEKVQKWKEAVEYIAKIRGLVWDDLSPFHFDKPCPSSDDVLARYTGKAVKAVVLKMTVVDPDAQVKGNLGFGGILFLSGMVAFLCRVISLATIPNEKLGIAVSWLVGLGSFIMTCKHLWEEEKAYVCSDQERDAEEEEEVNES